MSAVILIQQHQQACDVNLLLLPGQVRSFEEEGVWVEIEARFDAPPFIYKLSIDRPAIYDYKALSPVYIETYMATPTSAF